MATETSTNSAAPRMRWSTAPVLAVEDVVATANHYRDVLGFNYSRFFGEPPQFCMVERAGVVIMLKQFIGVRGYMHPNHREDPANDTWDAYIWIDDADALHAEYAKSGARIVRALCVQEYGCKDFDVEDCNGYRLCFGQDLEGS